jgi:hypothetical protein
MDELNYIKPKNSLRRREKQEKIRRMIKQRITAINSYQALRQNNTINEELVLMVANSVENLVKKKYQIDKKSFVVEILDDIFNGLNQVEKDNISNVVQFLFDNLLIQSVPVVDKLAYYALSWMKRKLL